MGKSDATDSGTKITERMTEETQTSSAGTWTCHGEFVEDEKKMHYLYNPDEKDPRKAWKKSEKCDK